MRRGLLQGCHEVASKLTYCSFLCLQLPDGLLHLQAHRPKHHRRKKTESGSVKKIQDVLESSKNLADSSLNGMHVATVDDPQ